MCRERRRSPRISSDTKRCRMYALVNRVHAEQSHSGSSGRGSVRNSVRAAQLQAPVERAHPGGAAVGHTATPNTGAISLFNVQPSPGHVATFAASMLLANVFVELAVQPDGRLVATIKGISTLLPLQSTTLTLWGVPAASSHDKQRCNELGFECGELIDGEPVPFVTNPSSCSDPRGSPPNFTAWHGMARGLPRSRHQACQNKALYAED